MGEFLYIDPLKQGLKHLTESIDSEGGYVFIHRSIKTRIETWQFACGLEINDGFYT